MLAVFSYQYSYYIILCFLISLQLDNETPSGLGLGLIPTLKACLFQPEEDDPQKDNSSRLSQTSSVKPQLETKSIKSSSSIRNLPSNSRLESSASAMASVENKSKKKVCSPEAVVHNEQLTTSTFDYELFMKTLPTSKKIREEYLLHEYDRRLKMQIAYQAANFELQDALHANNRQFKALIYGQRKFEQRWPLLRSKSLWRAELVHYDESVDKVGITEKEACFLELIKEGQTLIEVIQFGVHMDDDTNP